MNSHALIGRAQRRIQKLGNGEPIASHDPLLAEIALAQVDATLAIAIAITEQQDSDNMQLRALREANSAMRTYIDEQTQQLQYYRRLVGLLREGKPRHWWDIFRR